MLNIKMAWCTLAIIGGIILLEPANAHAAERPSVIVQARDGLFAGTLTDGRLIAQGRVTYLPAHIGFRVWNDSMMNGQPNRYRLVSINGRSLNVRLVGKGWQPDNEVGRGIRIHTEEPSQYFDVEVDGTQTLPVDRWVLKFNAVVLLP